MIEGKLAVASFPIENLIEGKLAVASFPIENPGHGDWWLLA